VLLQGCYACADSETAAALPAEPIYSCCRLSQLLLLLHWGCCCSAVALHMQVAQLYELLLLLLLLPQHVHGLQQ
jgi:hypothetical protein